MYKLEIDNEKQTIQGVLIEEKETFLNIRSVVEAEHLEGWQPTQHDIKLLIKTANNKDKIKEIERHLSHE